jgi:hypoxanthine-DNA glycosylase
LIGAVIGRDIVALPYSARLDALMAAGVGLWDVVKTAQRTGSLDSNIRDHQSNPLNSLLKDLPDLRAIAFNGATAALIGRRQLNPPTDQRAHFDLITLPSSSAAYCTISLDQKRARWATLSFYLAT